VSRAKVEGDTMLVASELMTENPQTIRASAKVARAVELLQSLDIRHLPVVDEDGVLVGMLSDRDLRGLQIPYFVSDEYAGNLQTALEAKVSSIMSSDVISVDAEADAAEIVDLMLDNKIGAVPVVDADGVLVGIISYIDVLRSLSLENDAAQ
jgi:acetoin utilization protein AcuB